MDSRYISDGSDIEEPSLCGRCKHKHLGKPTCAAFPGGIPEAFLTGEKQHTTPYPGDNGIRFEEYRGEK